MLPWLTPAMTGPGRSRVCGVNTPRATRESNVGHGRKNPLEPGWSFRNNKAKRAISRLVKNSRTDGDTRQTRPRGLFGMTEAGTLTCFERAKQGIRNRLTQRVLDGRKLVRN